MTIEQILYVESNTYTRLLFQAFEDVELITIDEEL